MSIHAETRPTGTLSPADASHAQLVSSNGRQSETRPCPPLSVIVPTRNEAGNIRPLLDALQDSMPAGSEVVFVDDSTDGTRAAIEAERSRRSFTIHLVHRPQSER